MSKQAILDHLDIQSNSELFVIYRLSGDIFESDDKENLTLFSKEQVCARMLSGPFPDMVVFEINNDRVINYLSPAIIGSKFVEDIDSTQDIGSWDVSFVTTIDAIFKNCSVFSQDINSWKTGA